MHLDDHGFEIYEENEYPQAYLLTWRTYGTWLHGDERGSVGRNGNNLFRAPKIKPNPGLHEHMNELACEPYILDVPMRSKVEESVKELCSRRGYFLQAVNVRTNHAHVVLSA